MHPNLFGCGEVGASGDWHVGYAEVGGVARMEGVLWGGMGDNFFKWVDWVYILLLSLYAIMLNKMLGNVESEKVAKWAWHENTVKKL